MKNRHPEILSSGTFVLAILGIAAARAAEPAAAPSPTGAQPRITTVAGNGQRGDLPARGGFALQVPVDQPFGVESGPGGSLFITSIGQHRVLTLNLLTQKIATMAGNGTPGYSGDGGSAVEAQLNEPYEVRFDRQGNMLFVEMKNHLIRRVDATTGNISTVAGAPQAGFAGDGQAAVHARFRQPHSIALDEQDNIYVADIGNHRIRKIDARTGLISTIAGTGEKKLPQSGSKALGQPILGPRALAIVGRTLWIALREGHSVWRLDLETGLIEHVAGTGKQGYSGDGGKMLEATFNGPKGIAALADGRVFLVDSENHAIRLLDTRAGTVSTIAGGNLKGAVRFDRPHGIGLRGEEVYIGDTNNHVVRRVQ